MPGHRASIGGEDCGTQGNGPLVATDLPSSPVE
jgi:hypothetical protein